MSAIVVYWRSDDGEYVAIDTNKTPSGVKRSGVVTSGTNGAILVMRMHELRGGNYHIGPLNVAGYWCVVARADLGWMPPKQNVVYTMPVVNATFEVPAKKISNFPHTCPFCGGHAYMGIMPGSRVDCQNKCEGSK